MPNSPAAVQSTHAGPEMIRPAVPGGSQVPAPSTIRPVGQSTDDAVRLASLRRMKMAAGGLLVVALAVYIVAHWLEPAHPWLGYVRATAEASLVGGIADWFAVTALFRRPLGLPIPHTAIMQTQKDRIGRILGNFVQHHFLAREVLAARLRAIQPAGRMGRWLVTPGQAARMSHQIAGALARTVEVLPEDEVKALMQRSAIDRLESIRLAPLLGDVLTVAAAGSWPQELLEQVLRLVGSATREGHDTIRERVRADSPRWVPGGVSNAVADRMINGFERYIDQVTTDPAHPLRGRFDALLREFIDKLKTSPEMIARAERLKQELLGHPMVEDLTGSIWDRARRAAERYRADPSTTSLAPIEAALQSVGESLIESERLRNDVDGFVADVAASFLETHRQEVADLIAGTVRDWDPELAARRIELAVGRDLQFIRLNGTLVGGLAGLLIYTLSRMF